MRSASVKTYAVIRKLSRTYCSPRGMKWPSSIASPRSITIVLLFTAATTVSIRDEGHPSSSTTSDGLSIREDGARQTKAPYAREVGPTQPRQLAGSAEGHGNDISSPPTDIPDVGRRQQVLPTKNQHSQEKQNPLDYLRPTATRQSEATAGKCSPLAFYQQEYSLGLGNRASDVVGGDTDHHAERAWCAQPIGTDDDGKGDLSASHKRHSKSEEAPSLQEFSSKSTSPHSDMGSERDDEEHENVHGGAPDTSSSNHRKTTNRDPRMVLLGRQGRTQEVDISNRAESLRKGKHPPSQSEDGSVDAVKTVADRSRSGISGKGLTRVQGGTSHDESAVVEECGEGGEYRTTCGKGEICCNDSCGICVPRGETCINFACGKLRGDATSQGNGSSQQTRGLRYDAVVLSLASSPTLPAKDRLRQLQLVKPEFFAHVSVKGFKRLILQAQKQIKTSHTRQLQQQKVWKQQHTVGADTCPLQHHNEHRRTNVPTQSDEGISPKGAIPLGTTGSRTSTVPGPKYEQHAPLSSGTIRLQSGTTRNERDSAIGARIKEGIVSPPPRGFIYVQDVWAGLREEARAGMVENGSHRLISVWDVQRPVTGLADVDLVSAMQGLLDREVSTEMQEESDRLGRDRADAIRGAMGHLWVGYTEHAWGSDEVKPLGKRGNNNWGGMGVTLVDSLDTLWLMGLKEEFFRGRDWVRDHLTFDNAGLVSVFETTIRVLGGLLSAFDLSRDKVFLVRAKELADRLLPAFGSSTGLPYQMVHLSSGKTGGSSSVLSELGTLQLEFRYLSQALEDDRYAKKVTQVFDFLSRKKVPHGLYPIRINPDTGRFAGSQVTFGALGDSFYEYLLKVWVQGGRREHEYRRMYDEAMDGVADILIKKTGGLTYLSEWNGKHHQHRMDHLACFVAGNLALGAATGDDPVRAARDLKTGKALAYTCYQMYLRMPTGLPPETVEFHEGGEMRARDKAHFYVLRPETLESFFILHQLTGDPVYREWGWDIFRAIERHCRIGVGFGSHPDVLDPGREAEDHMESFFPGETLKYLYLLMQPGHPIDLTKYTFNTEAHPLRIFS